MKKIAGAIAILLCMTALAGGAVSAGEILTVMNAYTSSDSIVLFVKDQGTTIENVYLGNDEAQAFQVEEAGPVRTVAVVDNSLSIRSKYRDTIKAFLIDLAAARNDGDTFTIATYAEDIVYLVQDSSDYLDIKAKVEEFEFSDQESYFTNALYRVLDDIGASEDVKYTRVIIIADGIDNEALGYTDEELNKRIQEAKIPVYTIGCASKGNEENLKRMFSVSRISNAKSYHLDEVSETDMLQDIAADAKVNKVTVVPRDKSCDGTNKAVRISYGEDYAVTEVTMPFKVVEESATAEPVPEPTEEPAPVPTAEPVPEPTQEPKSGGFSPVAAWAAAAAVLIALIAAVIVIITRNKAKNKITPVDISKIGVPDDGEPTAMVGEEKSGDATVLLGNGTARKEPGSPETVMMRNNSSIRLILQDMGSPSRTFEYPLRDKVLIGRDAAKCQIVIDYSRFVSSVHCEIIVKGRILYVRDGGGDVVASTNGTFVNGKKVAPELQLPSGSVLQLGQVKFKVTYK